MRLGRPARIVLGGRHGRSSWWSIYVPLVVVLVNSFSHRRPRSRWPPPGLHARVVGQGVPERRRPRGGADERAGRARRDGRLARARHADLDRPAALRVLRPRRDQPADHPADRAARHHHRYRAEQLLPHDHGRPAVDLDGRHRPRDLLHRHGLQQRDRAPAPHSAPTSRRPRPTSAPASGRRSGWSPSRSCARPCSPAACSPSR